MNRIIELWNNLPQWQDVLKQGTYQTLQMVFVSTLFAYLVGIPLGTLLYVTKEGHLLSHPKFNAVIGWIVNMLRSIPFIILMIYILPFTRKVVGTGIGTKAAIVPLVVGSIPFVARMVESSLEELDQGLIEASEAMGATHLQTIFKVILPESLPSIIRGVSITIITLIGYSAMAGTVGGGGLGFIAISYGYQRYEKDVLIYTIILLIVIVQVVQSLFNLFARKIDKRNK